MCRDGRWLGRRVAKATDLAKTDKVHTAVSIDDYAKDGGQDEV